MALDSRRLRGLVRLEQLAVQRAVVAEGVRALVAVVLVETEQLVVLVMFALLLFRRYLCNVMAL